MDFNLHAPSPSPSVHSQAMDFNVYAGGEDSSLACTPPNGYFASQALRAGLLRRTAMHSLPLPFPDRKAIGREIMKERIREEILAGEMAERRRLEDEVRREMEMERIMEMRRIRMERTRFSLLAGTSDMANQGNQMTQSFFPSSLQGRSGASRQDAAEFAFRERPPSHLLMKKPTIVQEQSSLHHSPERFLQSKENTTSNFKLSGTKRKTREESLFPVKKQWGCSLCEVYTTCEKGLKAHLEGKKHKAKEAQLPSKKTNSKMANPRKEPLLTSAKTRHLQPKKNGTPQTKGTSAGGPKNKQPLLKNASTLQTKDSSASVVKNKKQPVAKGASSGAPGKKFRCSLCNVKCNSENMLVVHRAGRRHKAFMELKKDSNRFVNNNTAETGAPGFVKEDAEAGAEGLSKGGLGTGDASSRNGVDVDGN